MIGSALYEHLLNTIAFLPKYITDRPQETEKQSGGKNKAVLILYKFVYLQ